jgi:DNA topoisomerase VI subunit A
MEREGELRGKLCGKLGRLLDDITGGKIRSLDDLGIVPNPRFVLLSGPVRLRLDGHWLDLGLLHGSFRLAQEDIVRAEEIATTARRCVTVENETTFHELAKLRSGELLIQTSYPGSGTLKLLQRLSAELEFWHFGDSDEAGFDILRVLRETSGRNFQPLHMRRGQLKFEQESRGHPNRNHWPFYQ